MCHMHTCMGICDCLLVHSLHKRSYVCITDMSECSDDININNILNDFLSMPLCSYISVN